MLAIALAIGVEAHAQQALPQVVSNAIVGVVTDTSGTPIGKANIYITALRRSAETGADGTFRFDGIARGRYELNARVVGYLSSTRSVAVGEQGGAVNIVMQRVQNVLPGMVTRASRGGLSGVIGDTAYHAMSGVSVSIAGSGHLTRTDSTGAFFLPLKPGQYMVRFERDGFVRELMGVTIPEAEGRQVAAWMVPQSSRPNPHESAMLFEQNQRMIRASPVNSHFFGREELLKFGAPNLERLARRWGTGQITGECMVAINGGPDSIPMWQLKPDELEFLEVYLPSGTNSRRVTSIRGNATKIRTSTSMRPGASQTCGNITMIAWVSR